MVDLTEIAPARAGFSASRLERITDHIERQYIAPGRIAGAQVAVARHGHAAYFHSFGRMDVERDRALTDDTVFRIYSMTKPIVSIALMMLHERGLFQLSDPVARYFPSWANHRVYVSGQGADMVTKACDRPMIVKDLLTHMSGLTYGGALPFVPSDDPVDAVYKGLKIRSQGSSDTTADFIGKLAQVPLRFQPGTRWEYSLATDVCGALVETISGRPLDEFLRTEIFEPLGMVDTGFFVRPDQKDRFAANYQRVDKKLKLLDDPATSLYLTKPNFCSGGGGLVGTTSDYMKFCHMLCNGGMGPHERIIGSRTLSMMRINHLPNNADLTQIGSGGFSETAYAGIGFGLGFATTMDRAASNRVAAGTFYWGGAASTLFWIDPEEDLTVTFMTQLMPSTTFNFRGQLENIIYGALND
jgi:CubicO group peptidase (beta-lactamase class C family)